MEQEYFVIYFEDGGDMPYCRVAYTNGSDFGAIDYNGYSIMANWWDATLFKTKDEALKVILNNVDTPRIQKTKLKIINIKVKGEFVYGE